MGRLVVEPCGSKASAARYRQHLRAGEDTCPDCRRAHADAVNDWRRQAILRHAPREVAA